MSGVFDSSRLDRCVGCGLCLSSCPTYQVTGLERHGPRGRIAAMRLVQDGTVSPLDAAYTDAMETCVQCRACELACPSDVLFGALMETARADLLARAAERPRPVRGRHAAERAGFTVLEHPRALAAASRALGAAQTLKVDRVLPERYRLPVTLSGGGARVAAPTPLRRGATPAHLFRGCVMDAWFTQVHEASVRVLAAAGYDVRVSSAPLCCGALQVHAGHEARARRLAEAVVEMFSGTDGPIVVDSAGCGAHLQELDRLLDTPAARRVAARVMDVSAAALGGELPALNALRTTVAHQAPCHLRNVQKADGAVRQLLAKIPELTVIEPDDGQLCCGAGGAYQLLQAELSDALGERKVSSLRRTGASLVVSSNPGCAMQIARHGLQVTHPVELVAAALP